MYLSKSKIKGFLPLGKCLASTLPMQSFATANLGRIFGGGPATDRKQEGSCAYYARRPAV